MIKLQGVSKSYFLGDDEVKAVDEINLEIKDKEYLGILGTSGSGKSTLMYMIGLLDRPTKGSIIIDGKDVSKLTDDEISRIRNKKVGFAFEKAPQRLSLKERAFKNGCQKKKASERIKR